MFNYAPSERLLFSSRKQSPSGTLPIPPFLLLHGICPYGTRKLQTAIEFLRMYFTSVRFVPQGHLVGNNHNQCSITLHRSVCCFHHESKHHASLRDAAHSTFLDVTRHMSLWDTKASNCYRIPPNVFHIGTICPVGTFGR